MFVISIMIRVFNAVSSSNAGRLFRIFSFTIFAAANKSNASANDSRYNTYNDSYHGCGAYFFFWTVIFRAYIDKPFAKSKGVDCYFPLGCSEVNFVIFGREKKGNLLLSGSY